MTKCYLAAVLILTMFPSNAIPRTKESTVRTPVGPTTCESLTNLKLPRTTITSAQSVAVGAFTLPAGSAPQQGRSFTAAFNLLPAFCRVQGIIQPSSDSLIHFEVWLPPSGWNGKYQGTGNGAFAGGINFQNLAEAVGNGYASSSTDTGHRADSTLDAQWALGQPQKVVDYYYRAIHETAAKAKAVIRAFYGEEPKYSFFSSCSNGGRQALLEAQRYPADYDGIISGAPANFFSRVGTALRWNVRALEADPASYIPPSKLPALQAAVLAACDIEKDGFIADPTKCHFDPAKLLCNSAESDGCLTQPQITALKKIYAGPSNSKGKQLYPGLMPGGEADLSGWRPFVTGPAPGRSIIYLLSTQGDRYLVFQNPRLNYWALNFDSDVAFAEKVLADANATNPNLEAFQRRGGKLIIYHGWSDPIVSPMGTVNYYQNVVSAMRQNADFIRLYMVPGMSHCGGGPGPNSFGVMLDTQADAQHSISMAMERWVEKGIAPDRIIATKYKIDGNSASGVLRTRPLCPYPQLAHYTGSGSRDDATNFVCKEPRGK